MRKQCLITSCFILGLFVRSPNTNPVECSERAKSAAPPHATSPVRETKITTPEKVPVASELKAGRIREGSKLVDQLGEFQRSGEQFNFFARAGIGNLRVLENLALERVARAWDDNPNKGLWSVSGTITEFRGENYLLITRAVLKAQKPEPAGNSRKIESVDRKEE